MNTETIELSKIRRDGGTQIRAYIYDYTIADYKEEMEAGTLFPPIDVFYDGTDYWLADGFHRVEAAIQAGKADIAAIVVAGTRRDAILHAVAANNHHGIRRGTPDKRRAVETLLKDEEWGKWSDREIARRCKVSPTFVGGIREILTVHVDSERTYTTKHGATAVMNTGNIGNGSRSYAEVRELEGVVRDWLKGNFTKDIWITILDHIKARDESGKIHWGLLNQSTGNRLYRGRDLRQASNNVLDQLRQKVKEVAAAPNGEQETGSADPALPARWLDDQLEATDQEVADLLPNDPETAEIRANATAWELQLKILGWVREKITIGTEQQTITELQLDLINAIQNGDTGGFYWRNQLFASLPPHDQETLDVALSDARIILEGRVRQEKQVAEWRESVPVVVEPVAQPVKVADPRLAELDEIRRRIDKMQATEIDVNREKVLFFAVNKVALALHEAIGVLK